MGWLFVVLGPLISGAALAWGLYDWRLTHRPTLPGSLPAYTGSPAQALYFSGFLGVTTLLGLLFLATGVFQIRHGRQSRTLRRVILALFFLLVVVGPIISSALR